MGALGNFIEAVCDPFTLLCISMLASPAFIDSNPYSLQGHFAHPLFVVQFIVLHIVIIGTKKTAPNNQQPLDFSERRRARWYLLNGIIVHMTMNSGFVFRDFHLGLKAQKALCDQRINYQNFQNTDSAVATLSGLLACCVTGPLCLLCYRASHHRKPSRDALELVVSILQIVGTLIYALPEWTTGMKHFPVDQKFEFTKHYLVNFWAAQGMSLLWVFVPLVCAVRAFNRIAHSNKMNSKKK